MSIIAKNTIHKYKHKYTKEVVKIKSLLNICHKIPKKTLKLVNN